MNSGHFYYAVFSLFTLKEGQYMLFCIPILPNVLACYIVPIFSLWCFHVIYCTQCIYSVIQTSMSRFIFPYLHTALTGSNTIQSGHATNLALFLSFPIGGGHRGGVPPLSSGHCLVAQTKLTHQDQFQAQQGLKPSTK